MLDMGARRIRDEHQAKVLSDNVQALMRVRGIENPSQLHAAMKLWQADTQRLHVLTKNTIANIINMDNSPTLDTISELAAFFDVQVPVLLTENLDPNGDTPSTLYEVIQAFLQAGEAGRTALLSVARSLRTLASRAA